MAFLKPQPTLKGYNAWALERLMKARGVTPAEAAAWIIDRWIDENEEYLAARYDISLQHFRKDLGGAKILEHPKIAGKAHRKIDG